MEKFLFTPANQLVMVMKYKFIVTPAKMIFAVFIFIMMKSEAVGRVSKVNNQHHSLSKWHTNGNLCTLYDGGDWLLSMQGINRSLTMIQVQTNHSWILISLSNKMKSLKYNFICMEKSCPFNVNKTALTDNTKNDRLFLQRSSKFNNSLKCSFHGKEKTDLMKYYNFNRVGIYLQNKTIENHQKHWYTHTVWYPFQPCRSHLHSTFERRDMALKKAVEEYPSQTVIQIKSQPEGVVKEGNAINITCSSNTSLSNVKWYRNDKNLFTFSSILRFSLVNRTIAGVYRCTVQVGNRTVTSLPYLLDVAYMDSPLISRLVLSSSLQEEKVMLTCHGFSNPVSNVSWVKGGNIVSNSKQIILQERNRNDSGIYKCKMNNTYLTKMSKEVTFLTKGSEGQAPETAGRNQSDTKRNDGSSFENNVIFKSTGLGLRQSTFSNKGLLVLIIVLIIEFLGLATFIPVIVLIHKTDIFKERSDFYEPLEETEDECTTNSDPKPKSAEDDVDIFYIVRSKNVAFHQIV